MLFHLTSSLTSASRKKERGRGRGERGRERGREQKGEKLKILAVMMSSFCLDSVGITSLNDSDISSYIGVSLHSVRSLISSCLFLPLLLHARSSSSPSLPLSPILSPSLLAYLLIYSGFLLFHWTLPISSVFLFRLKNLSLT